MDQPVAPWTELLILQPTPLCNIDCSYCYLPNRTDRRRMPESVLEATFSKIFHSPLVPGILTVVWHAGEPLVLPISYYQGAFAIAERNRPAQLRVRHSFQSNGTLVTTEWVAFLLETGAKISLSIDGPAWLHDSNRRTRAGAGTHERAMRGLRLLQQGGIAPSVITVLTTGSLNYPDPLFDFYRDAGITDVAFNIEELEGANQSTSFAKSSAEPRFRTFLRRFLERMQAEPGILTLREYQYASTLLTHGVLPPHANQEAEPMRIISIALDGSISTYSPELLGMKDARYEDFIFGNILDDDIDTVTARVMRSRMQADVQAGLQNCRRTCAWYSLCGGGSPSNKLFEIGDLRSTETIFCRLTRQSVLDVVMSLLEHQRVKGLPA